MVLAGNNEPENDRMVVDFRGNPADRSRIGGWQAAGLILVTELCERICVMGISMNLVTYLVGELHISTSRSATIVTNFMGSLNLLALLAGFLADARLGRYLTVAVFATITTLGMSMLTVATTLPSMRPPPCNDYRAQTGSCLEANSSQLALLYAALFTVALGGGGILSNVSGFGSDQFDTRDPKEEKAMIFFFNRFYFCVSLGSLFAVTVLVYIQDNVGRDWGYGISAGAMAIGVLILLAGTPLYRYMKPRGSPLTVIFKVFMAACRNRRLTLPSHPSLLNEYQSAQVPHTERLRWLDKAAVITTNTTSNPSPCKLSTVTQVEEVKTVLKLLPIWSTCILFWTIYSQMTTFTVEQATMMNRNITSTFAIPAGSLSFFLFTTILIFTSLNEKLLVPLARKFTHKAQGITSLQRIGIGLIFSMLAMIVSATLEKKRRDAAVFKNTNTSVFWIVPQYFLVGAGEAFAYVGQLEFFIREAPERMKSMSTGLFLSSISMGFFVSSLLVSLVDKATNDGWIKNDLNEGRLDYFYWMLAIFGVINFLVFLWFAKGHEYKLQQECVSGEDAMEELEIWNDKPVVEIKTDNV